MLLERQAGYSGHYRAGVIGHTGRGNYAHGVDLALVGLPGVELVAVADPDEAGRERAVARLGAARAYPSYHQMLERESLDVVAIAPWWLDQREAMVVAAAEAGVKAIYLEKPLARSLDEADRMLAACDANGVKLAVAHQNRAFPAPRLARRLLDEGKIGRLRVIRTYSKHDERGGGMELLLHGTHMFDLMRLFAGDARWCHARVSVAGRDAGPADTLPDGEAGGLMAGDDVVTLCGFDHGITGTFESMRSDDGGGSPYMRIELCGTGGMLVIWSSAASPVYYYPRPFVLPDHTGAWEILQPEPQLLGEDAPPSASNMHPANQLLVRDLLAAVEANRQPYSSGDDARAALEMIMAVYESHMRGDRVRLPLEWRTHPLARWSAETEGTSGSRHVQTAG
jgi:predicted dehydrogenase